MATLLRRRHLMFLLTVFYITYLFLNLYILGNSLKSLSELSEIKDYLAFGKNPTDELPKKENEFSMNSYEGETVEITASKEMKYGFVFIDNRLSDLSSDVLHSQQLTKPNELQESEWHFSKDHEPISNFQYSSLEMKLNFNQNFYLRSKTNSKDVDSFPQNSVQYSPQGISNIQQKDDDYQKIESFPKISTLKPQNNLQYSSIKKINSKQNNEASKPIEIDSTSGNEDNILPQQHKSSVLFRLKLLSQKILDGTKALLSFASIITNKINSATSNDRLAKDRASYPSQSTKFYTFDAPSPIRVKNASAMKFSEVSLYVKPMKDPSLIIDTKGCKIPKMSPWDSTILHLIELYNPLKCSDIPIFMKAEPHGIIHLNTSILEQYYNTTVDDMKCYYQAIYRKHEDPGNVRENDYLVSEVKNLVFDEPLQDEYIAAMCFFPNNYTHEQYFPLVKLKKEVEEKKSKIKPPSPLNVILLGIDSVSKLNFLRHFMRTKSFLKDKMKSFDMKGYIKVGDNTFPNLVPLLTGHFVEYYWNESLRDTFYFDNISLIWREYAENGYRTFYAEDSPLFGTFNYVKRGFYDPPTDYYYRPLALAIENSMLRAKARVTNSPCLNSELETDLMYDYLINFVKTMGKRPYFAFCMVSILTHDFLNKAGRNDLPATRLLQALQDEGALNSSALVLFSDHGLRFGEIRHTYIGKFEERMPFMYIYFPKWFLDQNPRIERNLNINQDRLVTLFDVHATIKHLLYLDKSSQEETDELGLSLFTEIPENRTCKDANIHQHWCPCNNFNQISIHHPVVLNVSLSLVDHINELLLPYTDVCDTLNLEQIIDARFGTPDIEEGVAQKPSVHAQTMTMDFIELPTTTGDYLITLVVKPGGGVFEGTVRYFSNNMTSTVLGVSRISVYGETSWCIDSAKLKLFCYCKTQRE